MNPVVPIQEAFTIYHLPRVKGSWRHALFPADLDMQERLSQAPVAADILRVIANIEALPFARVIDVKIGDNRYKPHQLPSMAELTDLLRPQGKLKIDAAVWIPYQARFVEASCMYLRGRQPPMNLAELERDGDYWKLLKRRLSLARQQKDRDTTLYLQAFFDGPAGALAQVIADLRLLSEVRVSRALTRIEEQGIADRLMRLGAHTDAPDVLERNLQLRAKKKWLML